MLLLFTEGLSVSAELGRISIDLSPRHLYLDRILRALKGGGGQ